MLSLALSKCRSGAADCGQGMTQSLPLSYWSPEKSYMTSNRTATYIYIAARFRVNVSTLGNKNAKTYVKIEGITSKQADIIFISDVRAKQKGKDIEKLMGLNRNGCYKLYLNSTKEARGVGIAIKRSRK